MYSFDWYGKEEAIREAYRTTNKILLESKEDSKNWDSTENLYIEGDNLDALKLLQKEYYNKVKLIYIDPPYNTGNNFIYKDNFRNSITDYKKSTNQITKINTETNGRYHTGWLNMMYPRLKLARNLLTDDGVIFISIDDNEYCNMKNLCDEVFGEDNLEATFYIKVRHENRILRQDIRYQMVIEHLLCYRKTDRYKPNRIEKRDNSNDEYIYDIEISNNPNEILEISGYTIEKYNKGNYKIVTKGKGEGALKKYQIRGSLISQSGSASEYYEKNLRERRPLDGEGTLYKVIGMGTRGDGLGYRYIMQPENEQSKNGFYFQGRPVVAKENIGLPYANFYDFIVEYNNVGYEGEINFKNGKKPLDFILKIFEISKVNKDKDCIILDFFSGSASTAHATMKLNAEDLGKRKFIMVQIPENISNESTYYEKGFKNICEIGKERIRRAGKKILEENKDKEGIENLDIGFKVFKLEEGDLKLNNPYKSISNVRMIKRPKIKDSTKFKLNGETYYLVENKDEYIVFTYQRGQSEVIASIFNKEKCKGIDYLELERDYVDKIVEFNQGWYHSDYITCRILDIVYQKINN